MQGEPVPPAIAILPWGDVIEDYLGPLNLDARAYLESAAGGWLFGYVLALQHAGWRPFIVWASNEVSEAEPMVHPGTGVTVWLVPGHSRPVERWNARTSLRRWSSAPMRAIEEVIRNEGCQAILAQEYEDPRFDRTVALGRRLGIPVFASFQGGDWTASWLEEWVRPRSIARCAGLIIASQAERRRVEQKYAGRLPPIAEIPNPLQADEWKPIPKAEARRSLGIDQDAFVAFNHGRIDIRRKGLDTLVDAWIGFRTHQNEHLIMIGSGQDAERFAALLEERKPAGLKWHNEYTVDRHLIRQWLSASDVYVTASRIEGMPVAPLEAMACGLPIVATDANGLSDILSGGEACGGLIVKRDDPQAFSEALTRLRNDAEYRMSLGAAALKRVQGRYSIEMVGEDLKKFIKQ
jgi:starch synthase